jgi:hypothetical protein
MYAQFETDTGDKYGSFEVFYMNKRQIEEFDTSWDYENPDGDHGMTPGFYWWACFPGCLPDSEFPNGPFATEAEAIADAQDNA